MLPTDKCSWCWAPGAYRNCVHGLPPVDCPTHGRWTDLNLVARGRRAAVKCIHLGTAFVVLWVNPISDNKSHGSYLVQFAMLGVGSELYTIEPMTMTCPHSVFDKLVGEMREGKRPSVNRVPSPDTKTTQPGEDFHG